jgi:3-deoxy-D-manno-octulosonate 8-phosphate phosphatase (KDO 8-P phosphatase)
VIAALTGVRLVVTDVDGVLTTGVVPFDAAGGRMGFFSARDGMGVTLALHAGLHVAIVTGARSAALRTRAAELGVRHVHEGAADKGAAVRALQHALGCPRAATLYVGDDVNDLPAFAAAGVRVAVADAALEVRAAADWVTVAAGGHGALREIVDAVLRAQGAWERVVGELFGPSAVPVREG